jgi:hypothetical protein
MTGGSGATPAFSSAFVIPGRAAKLREPGIHTLQRLRWSRASVALCSTESAGVMDSGFALRAPRNDEREFDRSKLKQLT